MISNVFWLVLIYQSVHQSVYQSVCQSVYRSIVRSVYQSVARPPLITVTSC